LQLAQASSPHAFGNKRALILGDRTTDLQQEVVMGILAHGAIQERDLTAVALQLLEQQHLVDIGARQAIWGRHQYQIQYQIQRPRCDRIAQPIQTGSA
jgi:hypothetical protein